MEAFGRMDLDKDRSLTKEEVNLIYKLDIFLNNFSTKLAKSSSYLEFRDQVLI